MFFGTQTLLKAAWACQYYSHWKIGPVSPEMLWETNIWPFHRKWRWSTQLWVRLVNCEIFHQSAMLCLDFPISSTNLWIWRFFGMDRFLPVPIGVPPQGHWDVACCRPAAFWDGKSPTRFVMELGIVHSCGSDGNICEVSGMLNSSSIPTFLICLILFAGLDKGNPAV